MQSNRAKNVKRNIIFGIINKMINILLPFITRTVLIHKMGVEYLGLDNLFISILKVLNLAELGFSNAIVFSMYRPIVQGDSDRICGLLKLYRKAYQCIGGLVCAIGICIIPILPRLINGALPNEIHLTALYLIYLANTVLSYFLYAYLGALLTAHQRSDVLSNINTGIVIFSNILQIAVIYFIKNYYLYTIILILGTLANNIVTAIIAKKFYPQFTCKGKISKDEIGDIKKQIAGVFIGKLCQVSRNSFDTIFISAFLGLQQNGIYNNYYYIMVACNALFSVITTALTAGIGDAIVTKTVKDNYKTMNKINCIYMWLAGLCTVGLVCLYQPFMELWMGEQLMMSTPAVMLMCLYFYILKMGDIRGTYVEATGTWWANRYRALIESILNIFLNYVLGKYFGIIGIISATLLSLFFINFCYGSGIIFKHYFVGCNKKEYFKQHALYAMATLGACILAHGICNEIAGNSINIIGVKILICLGVANLVYFVIYMPIPFCRNAFKWGFKNIICR